MIILDYCPGGCGRMTYPKVRNFEYLSAESQALILEAGAVKAVTTTGICSRCWDAQHDNRGNHRNNACNGKFVPARRLRTKVMTDADIEKAREDLRSMWRDRRARGVAPEGVPTEEWAYGNGGLYSWQVP